MLHHGALSKQMVIPPHPHVNAPWKLKPCVAKDMVFFILMVSKKLKQIQNKISPHNMWIWVWNNVECYKGHEIKSILFLDTMV